MDLKIFPALFDRPVNIHFSDQESDEHIELLLRQHWITNVHWIILSIIGLLLPLFFVDINHNFQFKLIAEIPFELRVAVFILWYMFVTAYIIESFLYWYFNIYIITNKHIIDFDFLSLLSKVIKESRLDDVQAISTQISGILRQLFNFGDVVIETAAKGQQIQFSAVPKPEFVAQRIEDLQTAAEKIQLNK